MTKTDFALYSYGYDKVFQHITVLFGLYVIKHYLLLLIYFYYYSLTIFDISIWDIGQHSVVNPLPKTLWEKEKMLQIL